MQLQSFANSGLNYMIQTDTSIYHAILQSSISGFWMVDKKGQIIEVNDAYCKMSGYARPELLKMKVFELEAVDDKDDVANRIGEIFRIGHANFESQHRRKDGSIYDVEVSTQVLPVHKGLIVGFIHDITDRKAFSSILEESEMFLKETQQIGKLGTFKMNLLSGTWQSSEVLNSILGIDSDFSKTVDGLQILIHPDCKTELNNHYYQTVKNSNGIFNREHKIISYEDKKVKWVHTIGRVNLDQENRPVEMVGTVRDITEHKQREEELKLAKQQAEYKEQQYRSLSNNIPGMTYRAKEDWSVDVIINSELVCGYDSARFLTGEMNWIDLIIEEDRGFVLSETAIVMKKPTSIYQEYRIKDIDNSIRYVADYKTSLFDNSNKFFGVDGIVIDITDKKNNELELVKAKEKAQESDRLKSAFLANISHEIRTPMNGILGFIDLMRNNSISRETQLEYLNFMKSSGDRMMGLLTDLLDISRIESGSLKISKTDFNIIEELELLTSYYRKEAIEKGIELIFIKPDSLNELIVNTDKGKVLGIISNLINNAIKFTEQGSIEYSVINDNRVFEFTIKDTGIGIIEDNLGHIFERFNRVDDTIKREYEGAGLGLSISKAYVDSLGGSIWAESKIGEGSIFYFTIPVN